MKRICASLVALAAFLIPVAATSAAQGGLNCAEFEAVVREVGGAGPEQALAECRANVAAVEATEARHQQEAHEAEVRQEGKRNERENERREEREEAVAKIRHARQEARRRHREWAHKPTVTLRIAQTMAARTMRNNGYANGWVKCQGGRINRTHWECYINVFYQGLHGGMRVWGAGFKDGRPFYGTLSSRLRNPGLGYY